MDAQSPYRKWVIRGCVAACAALFLVPGVSRASKYDENLAPLTPRAVVASASSSTASAARTTPTVRSGRSGPVLPPWLSGGTARASRHHSSGHD